MLLPTVTVDIGTTSVKLCAFDADGAPSMTARHATPTMPDMWGEIYDLEALKEIVIGFVRDLDDTVRDSIARVTIAGVGESGGLVRPDLTLASPMILWHDHRGAEFLAPLTDTDRSVVYRVTGLPVNANYGLSKVAWSLAHADDAGAGVQWLNIAEYLAAWMTGQRWSERSLASRTMALDVSSGTWSAGVCALLGVDIGVFPPLRTAAHGEPITPAFARAVSLSADVNVHVAGHDHMVGAIGADLQSGEMLNSTGTTEGILVLRDTPSLGASSEQSKLANGLACAGSGFTLFASIPTGGSAFATLQTMLGMSAERLAGCLADLHTRYITGNVNLDRVPLVLPQFRGSPPPTKRATARGVIAGIESDTDVSDIVFGCFLGLVLQFREVLELFDTPVQTVKVIGPASGNDLWLQLKADLLRTRLSVSGFPEVVSRGAQALASHSSIEWESCEPRDVFADATRTSRLDEWYETNRPRWQYLKGVPS